MLTQEQIIAELLKTKKYKKCKELKEYANLIVNNLKQNPHKTKKLQKHHIVPKSVCFELGLHSDYNDQNTVFMDKNAHTQAHNLLALSSINLNCAIQARGCGCVKYDTLKEKTSQN